MTFSRPRSGIFAVVGGREYAAESYPDNDVVVLVGEAPDNPDPQLFERDEPRGRWRAEVLTDDCERLDEVTTRARHRGHECQVVAIEPDGSTGLYYLGPDKSKAARDGFVQIESGLWAKTVNIYELDDFGEHHVDLLYERWLLTRQ
jgi:hypothetical protein